MTAIIDYTPATLRYLLAIPVGHTLSFTTTTCYILDGSGVEVCHGDTYDDLLRAWAAR